MYKICIVYLVSPREHTHTKAAMKKDGISKMEVYQESLKTVKKYLPEYDVITYHEDYTDEDQKACIEALGRDIKFVKIDFENHPNVAEYQKHSWVNGGDDGVKGRPWGYRMMCRFFSGVMQSREEIKKYDYYIRLDHDSFFIDPKAGKSLEKFISETDFDYSFRSVFTDNKEKDALWNFTKKYLLANGMYKEKVQKMRDLGFLDEQMNYNGTCPYNNYHVCKVSFWQRPDVKKFTDAIEKEHGIVRYHWQDANIHAIIVGLFVERDKLLLRTDFGYRHNFHYSVHGSLGIQYIHNGRENDWP